jgi:hypothetical protein
VRGQQSHAGFLQVYYSCIVLYLTACAIEKVLWLIECILCDKVCKVQAVDISRALQTLTKGQQEARSKPPSSNPVRFGLHSGAVPHLIMLQAFVFEAQMVACPGVRPWHQLGYMLVHACTNNMVVDRVGTVHIA